MNSVSSVSVFLVCSGLGHVKRGYESFTQECFDALSVHPSLDITLFKGGGKFGKKEIVLPNMPRNSLSGKLFEKLIKKESYFIEQLSFFLSLLPYIYRKNPDMIFFSDFALGTMLWHWRRTTNLSYKLLFSNGAPNGPPFSRMDHVQHLTPIHYQAALDAGEAAHKHSLVPYGIKLNRDYQPLSTSDREALRRSLSLPVDRPIVLSVGTINKIHKRMDYVIKEIASLPKPQPYLVLLGQTDEETAEIIALANQRLGTSSFQIKTVSLLEVRKYYQVADAFVLASLNEGLPRVTLEAMAYGVPCLAHDYEVTRFVLMNENYLSDFTVPGNLACLIQQALAEGSTNAKRNRRHQVVYENFSWENLRPAYVKLIFNCMNQ